MESVSLKKYDKAWIGFIMGLSAAVLSYFLYASIWALIYDVTLDEFFVSVFNGFAGHFRSKIITVCALSDVLLFYIFLRKNYLNLCKGLLAVLVLTVPVIIYLY